MNVVSQEHKVDVFKARLESLYSLVRRFANENRLELRENNINKSEEHLGTYTVPGLTVTDGDNAILELRPFGINIIAAEGRVDAVGTNTTQKLVYMSAGGPVMRTRISSDLHEGEEIERRLYPDVVQEGWYWVHDRPTRRTTRIDDGTLTDLFQAVSGYALR